MQYDDGNTHFDYGFGYSNMLFIYAGNISLIMSIVPKYPKILGSCCEIAELY